jgi:hypothetical protein
MDDTTRKVALAILKHRKEAIAELQEARQDAYNRHENFPYCIHGTFIGDPYGADYMCGLCESGEDSEYSDGYALSIREAHRIVNEYNEGIVLLVQLKQRTGDNHWEYFVELANDIRHNTIGRYVK